MATKKKTTTPKKSIGVSKPGAIRFYEGSDNQTLVLYGFAAQKYKNKQEVQNFRIQWLVLPVNGGTYYPASETSCKAGEYPTFDIPSNCIDVQARVFVESVKHTDKCKPSGSGVIAKLESGLQIANRVTQPGTFDLTLKEGSDNFDVFTASVTNYSDTSGGQAYQIEFEFNNENGPCDGTKIGNSTNGIASVEFTGQAGHEYRLRVRAKAVSGTKFRDSAWTNYSTPVKTKPAQVAIAPTLEPQIRTTEAFPIKVSWGAAAGAETYHIEWTKNKDWFDINTSEVHSEDTQTAVTSIIVSDGLDTSGGGLWYFRVRGHNSAGEGAYSPLATITIGAPPAAPTTWSYETILKIGEDAHLCWTHNSEDGSPMTAAKFAHKIVNGDGTPAESAFDRFFPGDLVNQFLDDLNIGSFDEITEGGSTTVEGRRYIYVVETAKITITLTMDQQTYKIEYIKDGSDLIVTRPDEPKVTIKFPAADPSGLTSHMPASYIKYCNRIAGEERWPEGIDGYHPEYFPATNKTLETITSGVGPGVYGSGFPLQLTVNPRTFLYINFNIASPGTIEDPISKLQYSEKRSVDDVYNYNIEIEHHIGSRSIFTDLSTESVYTIWFDDGFDQSETNKNATRLYITPSTGQGSIYYVKSFIRNAPYFNAQSMELLYPGSENPVVLTPSTEYMVYEFPIPQSEDPTKVIKTYTYIYETSALLDSQKVYWKVATKGVLDRDGPEDDGFGEYSVERSFTVYSPPSVTLTVEDGGIPYEGNSLDVDGQIVTSFPLTITAHGEPNTQTPIGYNFQIISRGDYDVTDEDGTEIHVTSGEVVWERYFVTDKHHAKLELGAGAVFLQNQMTYSIHVEYTTSLGLSAENSIDIYPYWNIPSYNVSAEVAVDTDNLVAFVRPFLTDENDEELNDGAFFSVYRRDPNGEMIELASHLDAADNVTVTDIHPALDFARYRVVAIDKGTGAASFADLPGATVGEKGIVIHWDEAWQRADEGTPEFDFMLDVENEFSSGSLLRLPYNIDVSDDMTKETSLIYYAGRRYPVSYYGDQRVLSSTWSTTISKRDTGRLHAIRRLAMYGGDSYIREPNGTGYWASISVSYNITHSSPVVPVSIKISRVAEHEDSVNGETSAILFTSWNDGE